MPGKTIFISTWALLQFVSGSVKAPVLCGQDGIPSFKEVQNSKLVSFMAEH